MSGFNSLKAGDLVISKDGTVIRLEEKPDPNTDSFEGCVMSGGYECSSFWDKAKFEKLIKIKKIDPNFLRICAVHKLVDRGIITSKTRAAELIDQKKGINKYSTMAVIETWPRHKKLFN